MKRPLERIAHRCFGIARAGHEIRPWLDTAPVVGIPRDNDQVGRPQRTGRLQCELAEVPAKGEKTSHIAAENSPSI
jgi:hypothetical protein